MKKPHLLSIDLEDWFHILENESTKTPKQWENFTERVEENTEKLLDLFTKHHVKATFFVLSWVAERHPNLIKRIHQLGHEIASHTYSHQLIYEQSATQFEEDLKKSIAILSELINEQITMFRAPGFSITKECLWAFEILAKNGIEYDSSVFPAARAHGGMNGYPQKPFSIKTDYGTIKEFPISTFSFLNKRVVFSGGGYFRLFPINFLKKQFSNYERRNESVVTYFHPRDIDPEQPKLALSRVRTFKSYVNLDTTLAKLDVLLSHFKFTTMSDLARYHDFDIELSLESKNYSLKNSSINQNI